jgi:hypothetical protein
MAEQSNQLRLANDLLTWFERVVAVWPSVRQRSIVQRLMRADCAVVIDVSGNEEVEGLLSENNEVVHTLIRDRLDPSLNEYGMVGGVSARRDHSGAGILKRCIEPSAVLPFWVAGDAVDTEPFITSMFEEHLSLPLHPFGMGFEATGRSVDAPGCHVDEGQHKTLAESPGCPDALDEEVDLPQRFGVNLEELLPSPCPPLGRGCMPASCQIFLIVLSQMA